MHCNFFNCGTFCKTFLHDMSNALPRVWLYGGRAAPIREPDPDYVPSFTTKLVHIYMYFNFRVCGNLSCEKKFIVAASSLLELLFICRKCNETESKSQDIICKHMYERYMYNSAWGAVTINVLWGKRLHILIDTNIHWCLLTNILLDTHHYVLRGKHLHILIY